MGILEKKILLCLVIVFGVCVSVCSADSNQYFDSKVDYFEQPKKDCLNCKAQQEMNQSVAATLDKVKTASMGGQKDAGSIELFVDASCQYSDLALKNLSSFNKMHPDLAIKVSISGSVGGFLEIAKSLVQDHPLWDISNDLTGDVAKNSDISKVPAYIFTIQGKTYRIYGEPIIEDVWERINAPIK